jgi:hypothetical protein
LTAEVTMDHGSRKKMINETARESKRNARVAKKYKIYKYTNIQIYLKTGARRN